MPDDLKDLTRTIVGRLAQEIEATESLWDDVERDFCLWLPLGDYVAHRNHADLEGIISRTEWPGTRSRVRCVSPSGWPSYSPLPVIGPDRFTLKPGEASPFLFRYEAERLVSRFPESLELLPDSDPPPGAERIYPYPFRFLLVDSRARKAAFFKIVAEVVKSIPDMIARRTAGQRRDSAPPSRRRLSDRQKVIRRALRLGLKGQPYARYLDSDGLVPREEWKKRGCPDSYPKAYSDPAWRRDVVREKSQEADRVKAEKSQKSAPLK
jgi:hypothetical protein